MLPEQETADVIKSRECTDDDTLIHHTITTNLFPGVEMHAGYLAVVRISHVYIQTLALIYEGTSVCGHVNNNLL